MRPQSPSQTLEDLALFGTNIPGRGRSRAVEVLLRQTASYSSALVMGVGQTFSSRAHIKEKLKSKDATAMVRFAVDWVTSSQSDRVAVGNTLNGA